MDFLVNCALGLKVNTIAHSLPEAVSVHQWVCGLDMGSAPELLNAAKRDAEETGLAFTLLRLGADAYGKALKKLYPRLPELALTLAAGSDAWWWDSALDRVQSLLLLEQGVIECRTFGASEVPVPPPAGFSYGDLFAGQLRAGRAWHGV